MHILHDPTDLQTTSPNVAVSLDAVGVAGVVRGIVLHDGMPATATIDVDVELPGDRRGAHMSRFHEAIDRALALVGSDGNDVDGLDLLATVIAAQAAELQDAPRARAIVRATVAKARVTPASGRRSVDPVDVWGAATIDRLHTTGTSTLGTRASGMTACPCAQALVASATRTKLLAAGVSEHDVELVLTTMPVATHNQRGTGTLELVVPHDGAMRRIAEPLALAALVRASMSAATHELLKRPDELAVVEQAHAHPRFVEDCVREMLRLASTAPELAGLPADTVVRARQINHESIHSHDVEASASATLRDLASLAMLVEPS